MITFLKERSFYKAINNDAVIINFLFGYKISVHNDCLKMDIAEKDFLKVKNYLIEKQISFTIFYDDVKCEKNIFSNKNYEILFLKTQKEYPSAYDLIEKINELKPFIDEVNNSLGKFEEISFCDNISNLMDSAKKVNFENIISDYKQKNPKIFTFCDNTKSNLSLLNEKPKLYFDEKKRIKIGSEITLEKEDGSTKEKYFLVDNIDGDIEGNLISINNTLGQILIDKDEWDFVEYNGNSYQIIEVKN